MKKKPEQSERAWLRSRARTARTSVIRRLKKLKRDDWVPTIDDFYGELKLRLERRDCWYCHVPLTRKNFSVDHAVPLSRKGEVALHNLRIACKACNGAKGSLTAMEYRSLRGLMSNWEDGGKSVLIRLRLGAFNVRRVK